MAQSNKTRAELKIDFDLNNVFHGNNDVLESEMLRHSSRYITEDETTLFVGTDQSSSMNIFHINCRSIKQNFNCIKNMLDAIASPLTALAITEIWLTSVAVEIYNLPEYNLVTKLSC